MYVPVKIKLSITLILAILWMLFSVWVALPWITDLSSIVGIIGSVIIVTGLAFLPGLSNAFMVSSLLFDNRPNFNTDVQMPDITILIAAYNEESCIYDTIKSIRNQTYNGKIRVLIGDDGSTDNTCVEVERAISDFGENIDIELKINEKNKGKADTLNRLILDCKTEYLITIDADTYLFKDALVNIVSNITQGPPKTAAVAGTVLVRNSRNNFITRIQEWDYFHGISLVKRIQSMYQGTLVAQGAFSIYNTNAVRSVGGWNNTVGEDIVLTWALREKGYRVSHSENAISFTNVPDTYTQFFRQRKRWSRGLIEAFKKYPKVIFKLNLTSPFIWMNLMFPFNDFVFLFVFVPGLIAAIFFQYYAIVGIMTILLLPMSLLMNWIIFKKHIMTFDRMGLKVRRNLLGFLLYVLFYQFLMTPASLCGYISELLNFKKSWGTK